MPISGIILFKIYFYSYSYFHVWSIYINFFINTCILNVYLKKNEIQVSSEQRLITNITSFKQVIALPNRLEATPLPTPFQEDKYDCETARTYTLGMLTSINMTDISLAIDLHFTSAVCLFFYTRLSSSFWIEWHYWQVTLFFWFLKTY